MKRCLRLLVLKCNPNPGTRDTQFHETNTVRLQLKSCPWPRHIRIESQTFRNVNLRRATLQTYTGELTQTIWQSTITFYSNWSSKKKEMVGLDWMPSTPPLNVHWMALMLSTTFYRKLNKMQFLPYFSKKREDGTPNCLTTWDSLYYILVSKR